MILRSHYKILPKAGVFGYLVGSTEKSIELEKITHFVKYNFEPNAGKYVVCYENQITTQSQTTDSLLPAAQYIKMWVDLKYFDKSDICVK